MTREGIKNTPEVVDCLLDRCVLVDTRAKLRKRLEEVCDMAIKALEEQSTLDKIRAEIEEAQMYEGLYSIYIDRAHVLEIIDKYKAESEVKE